MKKYLLSTIFCLATGIIGALVGCHFGSKSSDQYLIYRASAQNFADIFSAEARS